MEHAQLKVGIIGAGLFVKQRYLPILRDLPQLNILSIYSRGQEHAEEVALIIRNTFPNIESRNITTFHGEDGIDHMLQTDIQACIVVSPIHTLADIVKKCLIRGKHVLSEKPIAKDLETAKDLILFKNQYPNLIFGVAENYRAETGLLNAAKIAETIQPFSISLLVVAGVSSSDQYLNTVWRGINPTFDGGYLYDAGVHMVATVRLFVGDANVDCTYVSAFTQDCSKNIPGSPDTLNGTLLFSNGVTVVMSVTYGSHPQVKAKFSVDVIGKLGRMEITRQFHAETGMNYVVQGFICCNDNSSSGCGGGRDSSVSSAVSESTQWFPMDGVKEEIKEWYQACVHNDSSLLKKTSPESAFKDVAVITALLKSGQNRGQSTKVEYM